MHALYKNHKASVPPYYFTVRKERATSTFTYDALRTKTLKKRVKTQRKIIIQTRQEQRCYYTNDSRQTISFYMLSGPAYFGSQGIVVKCTAAIFFLTVDSPRQSPTGQ